MKKYTARQFRVFCLLHRYNRGIDYSEKFFDDKVLQTEKKIDEFLMNVEVLLRAKHNQEATLTPNKWNEKERSLHNRYVFLS